MFRRLIATAALVVPAAFSASCVDDGASLRVLGQVMPEEGMGCLYEPDSDVFVLSGAINLFYATGYSLHLAVQSGLVSRESDIPVMTEPNGMDVQGADIEVQDTFGEPVDFGGGLPNPFSVTATGRVSVGGQGIAGLTALPRDYVQAMREGNFASTQGTVVLRVQLKGETDGKENVRSRWWQWPIEIISRDGCRATDDNMAVTCNFGQDEGLLPYCVEI